MADDDFGDVNWVIHDPTRKPRVTVEDMLGALAEKVNDAHPDSDELKAKVQTLAGLIAQVRSLLDEIRAADQSLLSG